MLETCKDSRKAICENMNNHPEISGDTNQGAVMQSQKRDSLSDRLLGHGNLDERLWGASEAMHVEYVMQAAAVGLQRAQHAVLQ